MPPKRVDSTSSTSRRKRKSIFTNLGVVESSPLSTASHTNHTPHPPLKMQTLPSGEVVITPRNFKLLEELEHSEKGLGDMSISYGLVDSSDIFMGEWNATIMGPHRVSSHIQRERERERETYYYVFGCID